MYSTKYLSDPIIVNNHRSRRRFKNCFIALEEEEEEKEDKEEGEEGEEESLQKLAIAWNGYT